MTVLLYNGIIRTMDPTRPLARALALRDGRVLAVGSEAEVRAAAGAGAEAIDLRGGLAVPGLTDGHIHFLWFALGLTRPNLDGARSLAEALARLAPYVAGAEPGAWVSGSGWNHEEWSEPRFPTRQDLDAVSAGRPVVLRRKDGHSLWANSRALANASIGPGTADPAGGRIDRQADGSPSGILSENAMDLLTAHLPPPQPAELRSALGPGTAVAHAAGLTGIHDMEDGQVLSVLQEAHGAGRLKLRVTMQIPAENLDHALALGLRTGLGDETLSIGHLKLFSDGSLGSQTAWMLAPYEGGDSTNLGVSTMPPQDLEEAVSRASAGGIACAIHGIGDRACREVLDVLERSGRGLRHRIEHVQILDPADLPRLARLGVVASMQPIHATSDRYMADRLWGARCRHAYAWRELMDSGAVLAFGSDCPVETLDPLQGIYAAVARRRSDEPESAPWYPEQAVTVEEALRAYTVGCAYACGQEGSRGMLRPGMAADVTVLSQDIAHAPAARLLQTRVQYTIVGGDVVYARAGAG